MGPTSIEKLNFEFIDLFLHPFIRIMLSLLRTYHKFNLDLLQNKGTLPGSLGFEEIDVQMLVDWEIDYFKVGI